MKLFQKSRSIKGSVLVFSLIILAFMLVSALSVAMISVTEKRASLATDKSSRSFQMADTGVELVLQKIYGTTTYTDLNALATALGGGFTCNTGEITKSGVGYAVTFLTSATTPTPIGCTSTSWRSEVAKIKSEGTAGNTKRAVEVAIKSAEGCSVPSVNYGGDTYTTITIGTQCWMKQNMRVGTRIIASTSQTNNGIIEKYCYSNIDANCTSPHPNQPDGGLYQWDEAMQYSNAEKAQGICPSGWHIPSDSELYTLENYLKDTGQTCSASRSGYDCSTAGTKLKPGGTSGFEGNLTGYAYAGSFSNGGPSGSGYYWSSSESGANALSRHTLSSNATVSRLPEGKSAGFSVRCLQD